MNPTPMQLLLRIAVLGVGALFWAGTYVLWRLSRDRGSILRLIGYPMVIVTYSIGFFAVLAGLGLDRWDDSSDWYWDTWLLFTTTAAVGITYAWTHFRGGARALLAMIPVIVLIGLIWIYFSTP